MIAQGETSAELSRVLERIAAMAPKGFGLGAHVGIGVGLARFFRMTYPKRWLDIYQSHSLVLMDPTICWAMSQTGAARWSEVEMPDPFKVLQQATLHGMRYGMIASVGPVVGRSILGAARSDREFTAAEMSQACVLLEDVARLTAPVSDGLKLSPAQAEALRQVAQGDRLVRAAGILGITESALKARLRAAREALGAKTTSQAIQIALENALI